MPVGILLAGGFSNRVGRDKASLPWGETDLLHAILKQMGQVCQERIVVMNRAWTPDIAGVTVVPDIIPHCGPLSGIHAGLSACREPYAFVTACDMPFFSPQAAEYLLSLAGDWDAVLPGHDQEMEPLFAIYNRRCIAPIENLLQQGTRKLQCLLPLIRHRLVDQAEFRRFDPQLKLFFNINTPEDYQAARQ